MKDNYKNSLFTSYLYTFLTLVASIFVTQHIFKFFDNSEYGVYILIVETIAVFEILDFGFSGGMLTFLSRETDNKIRINKLVSTLFYCQFILAILALFISISISFNPELLFSNAKISIQTLNNGILIASFSLFITLINKSLTQILYSRRRVSKDNFLKIFTLLLRVTLIFSLTHIFPKIEFLLMVILITQMFNFGSIIYVLKINESQITFNLKYFDLNILKEVWKVSSWFAIGGISIILIERFDNIMTGFVLSTGAITILVITRKLFQITKSLIFKLNNNFRPYFGKMLGQNKNELAIIKFRNLSVLSVSLASFIGGIIIIINQKFIDIWVGNDKYGGLLLRFLMFFILVFHSWKISYRAFFSSNLIAKELALSSFFEGIFNILLAYLLAQRFGLSGIVASTFISGIIVNSFIFYKINKNYKFEKTKDLFVRNIWLFLMVVTFVGFVLMIYYNINLLLIKMVFIFILIITYTIGIKHLFFSNYSFDSILKGKIL